jgi:hypothetical protein
MVRLLSCAGLSIGSQAHMCVQLLYHTGFCVLMSVENIFNRIDSHIYMSRKYHVGLQVFVSILTMLPDCFTSHMSVGTILLGWFTWPAMSVVTVLLDFLISHRGYVPGDELAGT